MLQPPSASIGGPDRAHAQLPPSASLGGPDRALARLIDGLAGRLGIDLSQIEVRVGRGADGGSASPTRISLSVPLGQLPSIGTIAHELAHIAQHRNRERPSAGSYAPDITAAEAEARAIGDAAAAGTALWKPRQVLPEGRVPRLQDASGVTAAPPSPSQPQPDDKAGADPLNELDAIVADSRSAERKQVRDGLHGLLTLTHDAVEQGLQVLDGLDFPVARALVRTLGSSDLIKFAHLSDDHHRNHPVAAATVLSALPKAEPADLRDYASPTLMSSGPLAAPMLTAIHGLRLAPLSEDKNQPVLRAVLTALATVLGGAGIDGETILVDLERGDRGEQFRELLRGAGPSGSEQDMLAAAIEREKLRLPANRQKANPSAGEVGAAAEEIAAAFAKPTGASAAASALAAFAARVPDATEFAGAVVAALDRVGTVDRILDDLPPADRYAEPTQTPLRRMLAARSPALTLPRIEKLLSYGVGNWWWVSDGNARFAYLLVRSLPRADQDGWRTREAGKWFERLERNYPFADAAAAAAYTGVGSGEFHAHAQSGKETAGDTLRNSLEKQGREASDAATAATVARRLAGRTVADQGAGQAADQPAGDAAKTVAPRTDATRTLDAEGVIPKLYDKFSDGFVTGEEGIGEGGRQTLLDLTMLRDPPTVLRQVADLLSTGIFKWWVTARKAWIASQLLRGLPAEDQSRFEDDHPGMRSSMEGAMTADMRASPAHTALGGRGEFPSRQAIRDRLSDPVLWGPGHVAELRSLIVLARAADDAKFVFDQSKLMRAWENPELTGGENDIVGGFRLYDPQRPGGATEYKPESLKVPDGWEELVAQVAPIGRWIVFALNNLPLLVALFDRTIKVKDFDLDTLQRAKGGDIGGIRLDDAAKPGPTDIRPGQPGPANQADQARQPGGANPNRLSLQADLGNGAVRLQLPELKLSGLNFVRAGSSYRTGTVILRGLDLKASFSDRQYKQPVSTKIRADRLDVDDLAVANPKVPGGAAAAGHVAVRPIGMDASATGKEDLPTPTPREGTTVPIWGLGNLLEAFANVVALKGGIPFSPSLVDLALLPATWNLSILSGSLASRAKNFATEEGAELSGDAAISTPKPLDYLWGLAVDGHFQPPRSVAQRMDDAIKMFRSLSLTFDDLEVSGLSLGADTQIAKLVVHDVQIGVATTEPAYLRMMQTSLRRALERATTPQEKSALESRLADISAKLSARAGKDRPLVGDKTLEEAEARMLSLEGKDRVHPGTLSKEERAELAQLSDFVGGRTGLLVNVGRIDVGEVSGKVRSGGATVNGIRLEGQVPLDISQFAPGLGAESGYLPDETIAQRFLAHKNDLPAAGALAAGSDLHLSVAGASLKPIGGTGAALEILADRVPSALELSRRREQLVARIATLPEQEQPAANSRLLEPLDHALAAATELEALQRAGVTLAPGSPEAVRNQRLIGAQTATLRALLGFSAGSASIGGITGGIDRGSGRFTASVNDVDVGAIHADDTAVERVHATVKLDLGGLDSLRSAPGDRHALVKEALNRDEHNRLSAGATVDATVTGGINERGNRLGKAEVKGLGGTVSTVPGGYDITASLASLTLENVELGEAGASLSVVGATVEGLRGTAELREDKSAGGSSVRWSVTVPELHLDRIAGGGIHYHKQTSTDTVDASIESGAVVDINAHNIRVEGEDKLSVEQASVGGIEDIRYRVISRALGADRKPAAGKLTTVSGTLAGGTAGTGAALTAKPLLDVKNATLDGESFSLDSLELNQLRLLDTSIRTPNGRLVIRRTTLDGGVKRSAAGTEYSTTVSDIEIGPVSWRAGAAVVSSQGRLKVGSATLKATQEFEADGKPKLLRVQTLRLEHLDVDQLSYRNGPTNLHIGRDQKGHPGAFSVAAIRVGEFVLPYQGDKLVKPTALHAELVGVHAEFGGDLTSSITGLTGSIDARSLTIDVNQAGERIKLDGLSGDAGVVLGRPDDPDATRIHGSLQELGGQLTIGSDTITVDDLHLASAKLDRLSFNGPDLWATIGGDGVTLTGLTVRARVELWKPTDKQPRPGPFKRAVLDTFRIDRVEASQLTLGLVKEGVSIQVPQDATMPNAVIEEIELAGVDSDHKFEWSPGKDGGISGVASLKSLSVKNLQPEVAGLFAGSAGLKTETVRATWVGRGLMPAIDVNKPRIHLMADASDALTTRRIFIRELGAESVHLDENLKATVRGGYVNGLEYVDDVVHIRADEVALPGDVTADAAGGTIPEIRLTKGRFNLDLEKMAPPPPFTPVTPSSTLPSEAQLSKMVDSLDGSASVTVAVSHSGTPLANIPITVAVSRGRVNYARLGSQLPSVVGFWIDGNRLNFGVRPNSSVIAYWELTAAELADAQSSHEIGLMRLAKAQVPPSTGPSEWGVALYNFEAKLSTLNPSPLPAMDFKFGGDRVVGHVIFSRNALSSFTLSGNLSILTTAASLWPKLDHLGIDEVHVSIRTGAAGAVTLKTGLIELSKLSAAGVYLKNLAPAELYGQIDELAAHNVSWLIKSPPAKPKLYSGGP